MSEKSLAALIEERFDQDSENLPVFNPVAIELLRMKESTTASAQQISELIRKDQSLAGRVLQVANSSFYGGLKQIDTLDRAVMRLGINKVVSLGMLAAQTAAYRSKSTTNAKRMMDLWRRAFVSAHGCYWVSENTGYGGHKDQAFLCGLFHDIGELFLIKVFDLLEEEDACSIDLTENLKREVLEVKHNELGYRLMQKWVLPSEFALIARDHHQNAFDPDDMPMATVRLLDLVSMKLGVGQEADSTIVLAATAEAQALHVSEIQLAELEVMLEDVINGADAMRESADL